MFYLHFSWLSHQKHPAYKHIWFSLKSTIEHNNALSILKHGYRYLIESGFLNFYLSMKFFALLRVWLYNGHCFKVKCVKYCWISDLWPFCLSHWSYTSTPMLISFMYTEYFYYFLLLKLQYEILVCQMKESSRGEHICLQKKTLIFKVSIRGG